MERPALHSAGMALGLPLDLGLLVRRRVDPEGSLGLIVGLIFRPSRMALVRWPGGLEFEDLHNLIDHTGGDLVA
jgi:hypothetical protein